MRKIDEIKAEIESLRPFAKCGLLNHADTESLEMEFRAALTSDMPLERLEAICAAEKDGRCVVIECRCQDCKHKKHTSGSYKVFGYLCANKDSSCRGRFVWGNDYCSYGEREEAEDALALRS